MRWNQTYMLFLFLPLGVGLFFFAGSCNLIFHTPDWDQYGGFEFTVWGDTTEEGDLGSIRTVQLSEREMTKASLLVLQNQADLLPFSDLAQRSFFLLTIGEPLPRFHQYLQWYASVEDSTIASVQDIDPLQWAGYSPLIVALNGKAEDLYELDRFLTELEQKTELILVNFGDHAQLRPFAQFSTVVQVPNRQHLSQELAAQLLFGGVAARRGIPPALAADLQLKQSYQTTRTRLAYSEPEYEGISSDSLAQIDAIIAEAIAEYAMPGCQILVAKAGQVVYHQAFGYHTYERERPVLKNDLYDLASLTKVAATTLASMRLYEEHKLDLRAPLGTYFKDLTFMPSPYKVFDTVARAEAGIDSLGFITEARAETDSVAQDSFELVGRWVYPEQIPRRSKVFDIPLRNLLTHTSGLQASLPIHTFQGRGTQELYSRSYEQAYTIPVAERLYLRDTYLDSLWNVTKGLHRDSARYRYSCVNMILMQQAIDSINQRPISEYISETFYQPMGLQTLCYNPRELFEEKRLVPTASDRWRGQILCGTVHDPTAALLGGVSGNAGLFSNANDLAILFQMMLNGGTYGGKRYLADSTIDLFTARQSGHRGFGFDKPPRNSDYLIAPSASAASYGHTGFTGTCVWVDPEHDLVYVFLSNRIHPSVKNYRINEMKIRQRVHQVIYNSLGIPPRFVPRPIPIAPVEAEVFLAANE